MTLCASIARGQIPLGGIARGGIPCSLRGAAAAELPVFHALTYDEHTYEMLALKAGVGIGDQGRDSDRYASNSAGISYSVAAYETAWNGGREVQNSAGFTEDITSSVWAHTATTDSKTLLTFSGSSEYISQSINTAEGFSYIFSFWARNVSGNVNLKARHLNSATGSSTSFTVTSTLERYSFPVSGRTGGGAIAFGLQDDNVSGWGQVEFTKIQLENSTGRADTTTPSEYCSNDVGYGDDYLTGDNSTFDSTTGDWVGEDCSLSVVSGELKATFTNNTQKVKIGDSFSGVASYTKYIITLDAYSTDALPLNISIGWQTDLSGNLPLSSSPSAFSYAVTTGAVSGASVFLLFTQMSAGESIFIDNVSIRRATDGRKVFSCQNGNSVVSNVVTEGVGAALSEAPWFSQSPAATNSQIRSNGLADAEYTATGVTVGDQDETGIDGYPGSACTLTATAANGTVIANAITASSGDQATCWYIKRKTGTGNIDITLDNGATWTTVTLDGTFQKLIVEQAALANPQIGIRIVTDTDAVIVGNAECYIGKTEVDVRGLPPIFTEGVAVSTTSDDLSFDNSNISNTQGALYFEVRPSFATAEVSGNLQLLSLDNAADLAYYDGTNGNVESTDGANTAERAQTLVAGTAYKVGIIWGSSALRVCVDGSWGTEVTYDGAFAAGAALEVFNALAYAAEMRDLRCYDLAYGPAEIKIDELMV